MINIFIYQCTILSIFTVISAVIIITLELIFTRNSLKHVLSYMIPSSLIAFAISIIVAFIVFAIDMLTKGVL